MEEDKIEQEQTSPESSLLSKGSVIGEVYEVLKVIGQSAIDDAYLVKNKVTGKRYVLKLLLKDFTSHPDFEDFFDEAKTKISDFIHPNIVGVHKVGRNDEDYFLVSSYVAALGGKSRTLFERLSRQGKVHEFQAKNIFLQICGGLHYAIHAEKSATPHYDLKPSNILFDNALVRLSDFNKICMVPETHFSELLEDTDMSRDSLREHGVPLRMLPGVYLDEKTLASTSKIDMQEYAVIGVEDTVHRQNVLNKLRQRTRLDGKKTRADHIRDKRLTSLLETYEFMSPEQKSGQTPDELSNIYSLGLILYFMLTGKKISLRKYIPPSKCGCNSVWDEIIKKCIDPNPSKRYQTINKLQHDVIQRKSHRWHYLSSLIYTCSLALIATIIFFAVKWIYYPSNLLEQTELLNRAIKDSGVDISKKYSVFDFKIEPKGAFVEITKDHITVKRISSFPGKPMKLVLPPGEYMLVANMTGYKPLQEKLHLSAGKFQVFLALNKSMALTAKQYVYKKNLKKPESGFPFTLPDLNVEILPIDRGSFVMGTSKNVINRGIHEQTRKKAKIPYGFWIAKQEVTQEVYEKIMLENPSIYNTGEINRPVEKVSWKNAVEFFKRLNERESKAKRLPKGYVYRIPTEKEWEYCCRADTTSDYNFGNIASMLKDYAWYAGNSYNETHEVGKKLPNRWGLYDMHGNVSEWTYCSYPDKEKKQYILRGGSWKDTPARQRSSARHEIDSEQYADSHTGLRIVLGPILKKGMADAK